MPIHEAAGQAIHYEIRGAASLPPMVLLHSLGANLTMWDKVAASLETNFHLLGIDFRGHGRSGLSQAPFGVGDLARDVLSILDHLGIETAIFCGISLGGLVGIWLGENEPARVTSLVLANTAARIGTVEGWEERIGAVREYGMDALARQTPERWFTAPYREAHPGEMQQIQAMVRNTPQQGYIDCCAALRDADLSLGLADIRVPSLVIAGTHDPATSPEQGRQLANHLGHAKYLELNASHLSAWECAAEFSAAVADFAHQPEPFHG